MSVTSGHAESRLPRFRLLKGQADRTCLQLFVVFTASTLVLRLIEEKELLDNGATFSVLLECCSIVLDGD